MSEWKPIETAPRTGKPIILYFPKALDTSDAVGWCPASEFNIMIGWWDNGVYDDGWYVPFCEDGSADSQGCSSQFNMTAKATHWMPLPQPPE